MLCQCGELSPPESAFCSGSLIPVHLFVPRFVCSSWNDDFQVSQSEILKLRTPQSAAALSKAKLVWRGEISSPTLCTISPTSFLYFWGPFFICIEQQVPVFVLEQLPVSVQLLVSGTPRMGGSHALWLWTARTCNLEPPWKGVYCLVIPWFPPRGLCKVTWFIINLKTRDSVILK